MPFVCNVPYIQGWLDTKGKRIVTGKHISELDAAGRHKMKHFVDEAKKIRKIVLKSEVTNESPDEWKNLIAMRKLGTADQFEPKGVLTSLSIAEGKQGEKAEKLKQAKETKAFLRIYPKASEMSSGNYDIAPYLKPIGQGDDVVQAQFVCINFQGHTPENKDNCLKPVRGKPTGGDCKGDRNIAWQYEQVFSEKGYDGYLKIGSEPFKVFTKMLGEEATDYEDSEYTQKEDSEGFNDK
jgi:hypothetical protein